VAFQSALDNDIIRLTVDYDDIEKIIMPVVREVSASRGLSLLESARECVLTRKLSPLYSEALTRFLQKFESWSSSPQRYFKKGDNGAIYAILQSAYSIRWDSIQKDVLRVCNSASSYNSLQQFFAAIKFEGDFIEESRYQETDNKDTSNYENIDYGSINHPKGTEGYEEGMPSLKIWAMVMHASKGLEYDEVILPFWSKKSAMDTQCPVDRKIAFVSLTRAKERVMISYANTRRLPNLEVEKCGPSNLVNSLLSIPGIQLTHEKNVDMGAMTSYGTTNDLDSKIYDPKSKSKLKRFKRPNSYDSSYEKSNDYTAPPHVQVIGTTRNVGGSTKEKGMTIGNLPVMLLPPATGDQVNNVEKNTPGHPLLCTYLRDVMKGEEPLDFSPSSDSISSSHISVDNTESTSKIKPVHSAASGGKVAASRISSRIGDEMSTSDSLHNIITEQVVINSNKIDKKEKKSREEILLKFSAIDALNPSIIQGLMKDPEVLKKDLAIYFKEALKKLFNFHKGVVPIGEIIEDGKKKIITRPLSSCTSSQLGDYLMKLVIDKRGTC